VSFTSTLPTPQIILKAAPPPPTDIARGVDELVSLVVKAAPADSLRGEEALSQLSAVLPPQLDSASFEDPFAGAGPLAYGYLLRMVCKGMIILPEDQNNFVYAWRAKIDELSKMEERLRFFEPEKADVLSTHISELRAIVDRMPLVEKDDYVYAVHFNLHARALRKLIEVEEWMTSEIAHDDPEALRLLNEMKGFAQLVEERRAGDIVRSADWNAAKEALSVAPSLDKLIEEHISPVVYLFNMNDWGTAKKYVDDYALIFVNVDINTLSSSEVNDLVRDRPVAFVAEIDTQPYWKSPAPAFYPIFYTVLRPPACGHDVVNVTDPCFRQFLGGAVPALWDYNVGLSYKVSGTRHWTGDSCGWGYKKYEGGAIVEVPYHGVWKSADWLGRYVDAISNCLLGRRWPRRILYLGGYATDVPGWHEYPTADATWRALCERRGWKLIDLR